MALACVEEPTNFLFVGNPGSGKSTILNSLIGEPVFKSGVSFGGGLTFQFEEYTVGRHTFMDTPGLADVQLRKQAAAAITEALKKPGRFKIFFVVTLEAGRVRPADKTTINLVLESAPISSFAIIFNKVTKPVVKEFMHNPKKKDPSPLAAVMAELWAGSTATPNCCYMEKMDNLEDEDNALADLPAHMTEFIATLPSIVIESCDVKDIQQEKFDEMADKFEKMLSEMKGDDERLRYEMRSKETQLEELQRRLDAQNSRCTLM